ncbi:hypothetical protein FRC01_003809 [Tulasnella sp. 417]|nr:hypothetical protein FRC01_003809 [Tulasnella sp. 417]
MAARCTFRGDCHDVLALISRVEASSPEIAESVADTVDSWDAFAADLAASYFTGLVLRWYEGLDAATQESWASLRASLLAKFVTCGDSSDDDSDESSGARNSCLVAWPAPPPLTFPGSQVEETDCNIPNGRPQAPESPPNMTSTVAGGAYTAKIQKNIRQRLSMALRIGKPLPLPTSTQSFFASHFIVDFLDNTPAYYRTRWTPIEIELPLSGPGQTTTYCISKPIPLPREQWRYLRIGFRLSGYLAPHEQTRVYISYKSSSDQALIPQLQT